MSGAPGASHAGPRPPTSLTLPVRLGAALTALFALLAWAAWFHALPVRLSSMAPLPLGFVVLTALSLLFPLPFGPGHKSTVAAAPEFAALLLFGPTVAMAVAGVAAGVANLVLRWRGRRGTWDIAFNAGQAMLAVGLAGVALARVAHEPLPLVVRLDRPRVAGALLAAAVIMYVVNTGLVAAMIGLHQRRSPIPIWLAARRTDAIHTAGLYALGAAIALVIPAAPWALVACAIPLALLAQSLRQAQRRLLEREERRTLERDLARAEQLKALGQLAAGVAHDVNNQLGVVLNAAALLRTAIESGTATRVELREQVGLVEMAAHDAATTVRRMQRFARRTEDVPPANVPVNLGDLLDDVVALTRPRWRDEAQAEGRQMIVRVTRGASPTVLADPGELREALVNLVHNAVDAMPSGGVVALAATEERAADGTLLAVLSVRDAGAGMDEATQARLFEPFFTTKTLGEGTGLGLAMVHGIVDRLHGSIAVESAPGAGTTVTIRFPAATITPEEAIVTVKAAPAPGEQGAATSTARRVLVVEDEDGLRRWCNGSWSAKGTRAWPWRPRKRRLRGRTIREAPSRFS